MPIQDCVKNGVKGKRWGSKGVCYTGKDAKKKAHRQGVAIEMSKKRKGQKSEFASVADIVFQTLEIELEDDPEE